MQMITPTQHERNEWARMAQAAYNEGRNLTGHQMSAAAACFTGPIRLDVFDTLQRNYREWLVSGFSVDIR